MKVVEGNSRVIMTFSAHGSAANENGSKYPVQFPRMPNAAWAWEFLRRNSNYVRAYRAYRQSEPTAVRLCSGATLLRARRRFSAAEEWGLLAFADPEKSAFDANVFWHPDVLASTLSVRLTPVTKRPIDYEGAHDVIVLSAINSRRVLLEAVDGARHILLNGDRFWIQLHCEPPVPVGEETRLKITIDGANHAQRKLDTAAQLLSLHRSAGGPLSLIGRNRNAEPLAKALAAYDVRYGFGRQKRSYRQVAEVLFGSKRVAEDWRKDSRCLKDQTRRAVSKGEQLVAGGYLTLLSKKSI